MKLILSSVLLASALQAGIVQCTPAQSTVVDSATAGSQLFACPGDPAAARARLVLSGSFQDNSSAGPSMAVLFSLAAAGFPALECTATGATNGTTQTLGACTAVGDWVDVAGLPNFSALVTGGPGSDPLPFNASASVKYEAVPEPSTLHMAGLLLAFGCYRAAKR